MNRSTGQFDELGLLTAALCDGEITPDQAARLEQLASQSSEAREFFLNYVRLHGELYWENAASADRRTWAGLDSLCTAPCAGADAESAQAAQARRPARTSAKFPHGRIIAMATVASLVVATLLGVASYRYWAWEPQQSANAEPVARVTRTIEPQWSDGGVHLAGTELPAGRKLDLRGGLAEVLFRSGARVILEGPATFDVDARDGGFLRAGKLAANVPGEAAGFKVRTPGATVVDRGTDFGVAIDENGRTEVHVFVGTVDVQPGMASAGVGTWREVRAGEAVRVPPPAAGAPRVYPIEIDSGRFVRVLPTPGSVAGFRALVARHPNLIHHYTFEGVTPQQKRQDKKGDLHLTEVVMHGGDGGGEMEYSSGGMDATTNAVRPYRAARQGNAVGVSLQSEKTFHPPRALTIELLLNFESLPGLAEGEISAAIATREDDRDCAFFVAAADQRSLVHLMDADAPWVEARFEFVPGDWYYLASTFRVEEGETTINTYVANVSQGEQALRHVVEEQGAAGVPAASRLGLGKGFARNIAHAYPWCGQLDEVAVYDQVLDRDTLAKHLRTLVVPQD